MLDGSHWRVLDGLLTGPYHFLGLSYFYFSGGRGTKRLVPSLCLPWSEGKSAAIKSIT